MKIAIVGKGAIGSIFAYYYRNTSPTILVKDTNQAAKKLLTLENTRYDLNFTTLDVNKGFMNDNHAKYFDAIIIAVKGYQLALLIEQLLRWVPIGTRLILIQNGMGGAQELAKAFPNNLIYTGTTTDAVFGIDENTYQITAMGKLDIGPLWQMSSCQWYRPKIMNADKEKLWAKEFFSKHPHFEYHDDIAPALFKKLAINAVINPLTASLQIKNGQLAQYPGEVAKLKEEIFEVYCAANLHFSKDALSMAIDKVIADTSNNWSSMQQDLAHHRRTENETVLGFLVSLASQYAVSTPMIENLYLHFKKFDLLQD